MIRLRLGRVDARESSVPSILGMLWQVCVRGDRQVAVVHGRQSEETSRFEAHKSSTPFSKPCPGCRYAWEVISEWQSRVGGDLGARLATAPAGGRAAAAAGSRPGGLQRHHSASCMTQLQAKHAHSEGSDGCGMQFDVLSHSLFQSAYTVGFECAHLWCIAHDFLDSSRTQGHYEQP